MGILSFFVVSLCWNKFPSFLHRKEMLIYFKRCCVDIKYRLLKQKKETKKLQKNNCCWYIATKLVLFFSAVYMYFTFTKIYYCILYNIINNIGQQQRSILLTYRYFFCLWWLIIPFLSIPGTFRPTHRPQIT